jgi:mandelamide amidase
MAELWELGVGEAAAAMRSGAVTAQRLAETLLARIAANAVLNAFIRVEDDQVCAAAQAADRTRAAGGTLLPLHGVPLALKDNIDTAGLPTTGGTPGLKSNRPKHDAAVVERLVAAGAIVLGKCNLHELAYGITSNNATFGPVRNPYALSRIAGGSSGGTAAAVAARLAPGGVGTDTGGSVRIPAALCGIVGFRPTTGRWSQQGVIPISHTRDTAGPMTRSVADCALLDAVVCAEPVPPPVSLKGLRLGVPRRHFWEGLDSELEMISLATIARFRDAGIDLVEVDLGDAAKLDGTAGFPIALHETVADLNRYLRDHGSELDFAALAANTASPDVRAILQGLAGTGAIPEAAYREDLDNQRPALQDAYRRQFRAYDVAALIFPTAPAPAPAVGEDETFMLNGAALPTFTTFIRNCSPGSVAGIPGLSLPAGLTASGLPIGIELDGPAGADRQLLAIGAALEPLLPRLPAPPDA